MCAIFDLEVYSKLTRIIEMPQNVYDTSFVGLWLLSPRMYYMPNHIFKYFPSITQLKIISEIPQLLEIEGKEFSDLERLKRVQIIGQKIRYLGERTFEGAPSITNLYLPSNQIEKISEKAFKGLVECLFLVLSSNRIDTLKSKTFSYMPKLWSVNLEGNRFLSLSEHIFKDIDLAVADISFNLLKTSSTKPILDVLQSQHEKVVFSVTNNLCKYFRTKIFTKNSSVDDVKKVLKSCYKLASTPKLPSHCYKGKCRQCRLPAAIDNNGIEINILKIANDIKAEDPGNDGKSESENLDDDIYVDNLGDEEEDKDSRINELLKENFRLKENCSKQNEVSTYGFKDLPKVQVMESGHLKCDDLGNLLKEEEKHLKEQFQVISNVVNKLENFLNEVEQPDEANGTKSKTKNGSITIYGKKCGKAESNHAFGENCEEDAVGEDQLNENDTSEEEGEKSSDEEKYEIEESSGGGIETSVEENESGESLAGDIETSDEDESEASSKEAIKTPDEEIESNETSEEENEVADKRKTKRTSKFGRRSLPENIFSELDKKFENLARTRS